MNNGFSRFVRQGGTLLLALQLAACGGDSGGGGNNSTSSNDTYTIGGTVTGAVNEGLTLENNGTDSLKVAGVDFEFPTGMEDGSDYNVTLTQPPEHQLCSVNNASGTVAGADIDDVSVLCRYWRTAQRIENGNAGDAQHPQFAFDNFGNAIAVWEQNDGSSYNINANTYSANSDTWGRQLRFKPKSPP